MYQSVYLAIYKHFARSLCDRAEAGFSRQAAFEKNNEDSRPGTMFYGQEHSGEATSPSQSQSHGSPHPHSPLRRPPIKPIVSASRSETG